MTEYKYQAYDMAILNLMRKYPECRTYRSILAKAESLEFLQSIVHNALNHLYDNRDIFAPDMDRNDLGDCMLILPEEYKITDNPHFEKLQDSIAKVHL